ncbi:hypothetical protein FRX31_030560, partial [Thalictrum thalictroides]
MEPFSSPTNPDSMILDKIPLWLCFDGLLLEHYNRITVGRVASAAGSVVLILPEDGLPKNNDGFRAKVKVDVNRQIKKGTYAESIERGDTWVTFQYPNLPTLHCKKCERVGHQKHTFTFSSLQDPTKVVQGKEIHNRSTQMEDVSQADWPHKQMPDQTLNQPMDLEINQDCQNVLEETIHTKPIDQSNQTLHIWGHAGNLDKVEQRKFNLGSRRSGKAHANLTQPTPITDPLLLSHSIRITEIPSSLLITLDDETGSQPSKRKRRSSIQKKNQTFTNKDQISHEQMIELLSIPSFSNKLVPCGLLSPIISHLFPQWGSHHISHQIACSSQFENTDEWGNTHYIQRNNEFIRNAYTNNSEISKVNTQLHLGLNQISENPTQSLQLDSPTSVIHSE